MTVVKGRPGPNCRSGELGSYRSQKAWLWGRVSLSPSPRTSESAPAATASPPSPDGTPRPRVSVFHLSVGIFQLARRSMGLHVTVAE